MFLQYLESKGRELEISQRHHLHRMDKRA